MDVFTVLQNLLFKLCQSLGFLHPGLGFSAVFRGQWLLFYLTNWAPVPAKAINQNIHG